jgi:tetratricopeptide (TPR) repeat protein
MKVSLLTRPGARVANSKSELLQGWKEIAAYVSRDERTVKRWEKQRGLPVRRMPGKGRANVYALAAELDAWLSSAPAIVENDLLADPDVVDEEPAEADPTAIPTLDSRLEAEPTPAPKTSQGPSTVPESNPPFPHAIPLVSSSRLRTGRRVSLRSALAGGLMILTATALFAWFEHRSLQPLGPYAKTGQLGQEPPRAPQAVRHSAVAGVDDLYFRGVYFYEQRTPDSLSHALDCFNQAIALDPQFAPSYAGLADTYNLLREYSLLPADEVFAKAREAAQKAVALDPNLSQGHAALAFADFFGFWKSADAEREFQTAIALDPNASLPHSWYGSMLTHEARYAEAVEQLDIAYRLQPSSAAIASTRALALGLGGHRNEGVDLLQEMINQNQAVSAAHLRLAILSLVQPRDIPRYLDSCRRAAEITHNDSEVTLVAIAEKAYRTAGEKPMWRAILAEEHRRNPATVDWRMAEAEAALGNTDQAFTELDLLAKRHDPTVVGLEMSPIFSPLHNDPRFQKLAVQIGLPPLR